ncbi:hypothetical protein PHET_10866 [Paragonimus heterotremus]|uniref:Uncharacterized protein n=1 Tax=Paragonimus heterotremus TaxID=100268 RepID=A0A8J4T4U5_9TREM|nr:hypothetical protein PHET_10866 [Paragonimus heterotremus]
MSTEFTVNANSNHEAEEIAGLAVNVEGSNENKGPKYIDTISPPDLRDENDEIWYGVGFGPKFLNELGTDYQPAGIVSYTYRTRSGPHGDLPNTGRSYGCSIVYLRKRPLSFAPIHLPRTSFRNVTDSFWLPPTLKTHGKNWISKESYTRVPAFIDL